MPFQRKWAQINEIFEEGWVNVEDVAIIQVQSHDFSILSDCCSFEISETSILESPLCAMTSEFAVENLDSRFCWNVLCQFLALGKRIVVEPKSSQIHILKLADELVNVFKFVIDERQSD